MSAAPSTTRSSLVFGAAVGAGNVLQVVWLAAGSRVLSPHEFGSVLAAQALYAILLILVDSGTAFHGARLAARGELDDPARRAIVRARCVLAAAGTVPALAVAAVGGGDLAAAIAPYCIALFAFALMNVWESYGRGQVVPYASYLLLRSALLALVAGAVAVAGGSLPVFAAGLLELAAIAIVVVVHGAWPSLRGPAAELPWRPVARIGVPALVSQFNFAAGTVVLGASGRPLAAAATGVAMRLVSGLQAVNGAVVAAVFPRVARRADWSDADARAAALSIRFVVVLCLGAVAVAVLAAGPLAGLFFESEPPGAERAIILGLGAVAASGLTLQLSSVLVAVRSERLILGASAAGAAVIVAGCTVAVVVAARDAAVSVMVAFAVAQTLTAVLLWRKARRATALPRSTLALACTVSVALPPAAALAAWVTDARIPVGVACGAGCAVLAGRTAQAVMARSRST